MCAHSCCLYACGNTPGPSSHDNNVILLDHRFRRVFRVLFIKPNAANSSHKQQRCSSYDNDLLWRVMRYRNHSTIVHTNWLCFLQSHIPIHCAKMRKYTSKRRDLIRQQVFALTYAKVLLLVSSSIVWIIFSGRANRPFPVSVASRNF